MPKDGLFGPVSTGVAITDAARAYGYATTTLTVPDDPEDMPRVKRQLRRLRVQGLVVIRSTTGIEAMTRPLLEEFPASVITGSQLGYHETGVQISQRQAAREVTDHLFDVGCRSVAHVSGPEDWYDALERSLGWGDSVAAHGASATCTVVKAGSWGSEAAYHAASLLFRDGPKPDAVFAANDLVALGVTRAARESGMRLPEQFAVAGFDNIAGSADFQPPLTSVEQPFTAAGRSAVEMLLARIRGETAGVVTYQPLLVIRESTSGFSVRVGEDA